MMSRQAESVSGFSRNHKTLIIVARGFAGLGWLVSLAGLVVCGLTFGGVSAAMAAVISDGIGADVSSVLDSAMPFLSGILLILSGMMIVASGQVMRVVSTIEANTQAAFLLLDRRLPNPHPDVDSYPGLNDHGMGSFPV